MSKYFLFSILVVAAVVQGSGGLGSSFAAQPPCSPDWYRMIEEKLGTGDGQGHGPDLGSGEWRSVVEFRLGVRGRPEVPDRASEEWCRYIGQLVGGQASMAQADGSPEETAVSPGPSYPCDTVRSGSIEAMICGDPELSSLDRALAGVYAAALKKAADQVLGRLKAEQRGWIKGRNECWKSDDCDRCVRDEYRRRIAELQAWYRLVPAIGPVRYLCSGNPADEVVATYFKTEPQTLIAERGDNVSLMFIAPSGSGARYEGPNEMLWEHQGEALIRWGYGAAEMRCRKTH